MGNDAGSAGLVLGRIRSVLERERARIYDAISQYPPPIPACDEQFNYLLEQREIISRQLSRLSEPSTVPRSMAGCRKLLDDLAASGLIGAAAAGDLRALRREAFALLE